MEHNCSAVATPDKAKKIQVVACYIRGLSEATTKRPSFHSPFRPENHSIEQPEVEVITTLPLTFERIPGAALLEAATVPRHPRKPTVPGQLSLF